ncbi:MAG: hypothetical protein JSV91_11870 [Phycisphaerales bacterium]|nr:MAG: hypothetical protein JSV91_11870 [Phycisphaerales bacterium]
MRHQRQLAIRKILSDGPVATQSQLLTALAKRGIRADQSTLSRDLRELEVRKAGGRYVLPAEEAAAVSEVDYSAAVVSFVPCGPHLIVMRTAVGQAQPIALAIDGKVDSSIAGTLAGDDTVFLATKTRKTQTVALRRLENWFGDKRER